jgi:hypothetical protein
MLKPMTSPPASRTNARRVIPEQRGRALHRRKDARVAATAANQALARAADVAVGRFRIRVEERFCRHHPTVQAVPALKRLLVDERLLHRMWTAGRREPFDGDDLPAGCARHRQRTRAHGAVVDEHRAGAALSESASEAWVVELQRVAQHIEQRTVRLDVDDVRRAVHGERGACHKRGL